MLKLGTLTLFTALLPLSGLNARSSAQEPLELPSESDVRASLAGIELPFIANEGQMEAQVAFYARTFAGSVFVTRAGEIVYSLPNGNQDQGNWTAGAGWTLVERFALGRAAPQPGESLLTNVSTFLGADPASWRSCVPTYASVQLGEVWPGIGVSLNACGENVEKVYRVGPGVSPELIRMEVDGALSLRLGEDGSLVAATGFGDVSFQAPEAYQLLETGRVPVEAAYRLMDSGYGFRLGSYDPRLPVIIDPLLQSTYLGGNDQDRGLSIFVTGSAVYVAGEVFSTNFPGTGGGAQSSFGGGVDAFIAQLNLSLTSLVQATYLGGDTVDGASTLFVTGSEVFVAGDTFSTNFPGTAGGAQPIAGGGSIDGWVARLNLALTSLNQATYLGGNSVDRIRSSLLNGSDVFVTGHTASTNLPSAAGGAQSTFGGGGLDGDGFVARLNLALTSINQSTYLGGSGSDSASSLSLMGSDLFVAGETRSTNFPGTAGGAQPSFGGGGADAFLARLNLALTALNQATYLGGSNFDIAIPVHATASEVFVAGNTSSLNFPGTAGGAQPSPGGQDDAFLARLNLALTTINQATYLGGNNTDFIDPGAPRTLIVNGNEVFLVETTASTNFPGTSGGLQPSHGGGFFDAYVVRLNTALTALNQATYLGGNDSDVGSAYFLTGTDLYVAGTTFSTNFPGTAGGAQAIFGGYSDAFVARMTYDLSGCALADGLDGGFCCTPAAIALPQFPSISHPMRNVCFQDCGIRLNSQACVTIGTPRSVLVGGNPVCGVFLIPYSIWTCAANPRLLWRGTMRAHYSRTWMASSMSGTAPDTQVWRFLLNGDLYPSAYLEQQFGANPAKVPPCRFGFDNRVHFWGYIDYARNCKTNAFSAAWSLNHDCDLFEHGPSSDRPGNFHPQFSYTFVGPAAGFIVDPSTPPLSFGQIFQEAVRKNDWAASPAICTFEEPAQGVMDFGLPFCFCGSGSGGNQHLTEFLQGQGMCGTTFVSTSNPPIPLARKRVGRWTNGAVYPGAQSLFLEQGFITYSDPCSPPLPDQHFKGVETIGGFPAFRFGPALTPLDPHFKDLGSANRAPGIVSPMIGAPYVTYYILNLNVQ